MSVKKCNPASNSFSCSLRLRTDFCIVLGHGGSDRLSDDSSKEGVSDSHPETLTDPEFSDPPLVTSSPPQSGDEIKALSAKEKVGENVNTRYCPMVR